MWVRRVLGQVPAGADSSLHFSPLGWALGGGSPWALSPELRNARDSFSIHSLVPRGPKGVKGSGRRVASLSIIVWLETEDGGMGVTGPCSCLMT